LLEKTVHVFRKKKKKRGKLSWFRFEVIYAFIKHRFMLSSNIDAKV